MKIGLLPQPLRGVVAVRGHVGDGRAFNPVAKVVLDVQVVSPAVLEEIRTGETRPDFAIDQCHDFALEFEALLKKYGVEVWERT